MSNQTGIETLTPQKPSKGFRLFTGVCGNRGHTIHRTEPFTAILRKGGERVARCECGLLVFMERKRHPLFNPPHPEDDYKGADHE